MNKLSNEEVTLENALKTNIEGEARFSPGDLSLYATDASNYRQIPIGVVLPKSKEDVIETVKICRKFNTPIVSRGAGTSLAGQTTNAAVVMDMTKYYHDILEINPNEKWARVQPGVVLDVVNKALEEDGLIVGPDPATHTHCSIGGMIGNNSCGIHAQMAGKMQDNVLEMEVMTYNGDIFTVGSTSSEELEKIVAGDTPKSRIYRDVLKLRKKHAEKIRERFPKIPRRVSGFNLNELLEENNFNMAKALVGSEGSLVTILEAKIKLLDRPKNRSLLTIGYDNIYEAGDNLTEILEREPIGLEGVDNLMTVYIEAKGEKDQGAALEMMPRGHAFLFVEFAGETREEANAKALDCKNRIQGEKPDACFKVIEDPKEQKKIWAVREAGLGVTARGPGRPSTWPGWEDSAAPPEKIGDYLRDLKKLYTKYGYKASVYGHFGQGCVHTRINFELKTPQGIETYRKFIEEAARLVVAYGGSFSGEHGDGQARGQLLELMYGKELTDAMASFKKIWDPDNKMNPGKVVMANSPVENLRFGADHTIHPVKTNFKFPEDNGSFEYAAERCVGVGKCRRLEGGTMCPSFMATHEEKHATRGRAHLLFEMLKEGTLLKPWREKEVKESLDLCLACKGCKGDCPVNVDIATYKAEFLSHYYKRRLRPIAAYSMGLIFWWNRLAAKFPAKLVNWLSSTAPFSKIIKFVAGIDQRRDLPSFAVKTFRKSFEEERSGKSGAKKEVIVWVDTFNNYFHPDVLTALKECLEIAGYTVKLPPKNLCCGRPLYDFGMLGMAKKTLKNVMDKTREDIRKGTPILFAEPSCMSVFTDELLNLFPNNMDAKRLGGQCYTLAQFIEEKGIDFEISKMGGKKFKLHGHCHAKSLGDMEPDKNLLKNLGDVEELDSGCCGMAGSFGFERGEKYDVSVKAGKRALISEANKTDENNKLVADGFSCREQVKQMSGYYPPHLAQALRERIKDSTKDKSQ